MRYCKALILLVGTTLAAGCLVGETTHTLYLDPDGSVTWNVLERNIRSDATDPAERRGEEDAYISRAWAAGHPIARALAGLGARSLDSRVLRPERPFTVMTEARFRALDELADEFVYQLGVAGSFDVETEGPLSRFVLSLHPDEEEGEEENEEVLALVADLDDYRIVLTRGRFVEATGFEISDDRTVAIPEELSEEEVTANDGALIYSLTWTLAEAP